MLVDRGDLYGGCRPDDAAIIRQPVPASDTADDDQGHFDEDDDQAADDDSRIRPGGSAEVNMKYGMPFQLIFIFEDIFKWIKDIFKWIKDIFKWIKDIFKWIKDIFKWFEDIFKWIKHIYKSY